MSTQIDRLRGLARTGATLLRSGADALERIAGSEGDEARFSKTDPPRDSAAKDLDDVTIARKVESVMFRGLDVDKGAIDVNVAGGVVYLRGEAPTPEDVRELVARAEAVPEVARVENLLHLPKTPAATRTDTPKPQRKEAGRRTRPRSPEVHVTPDPVTEERPVEGAEPSPKEQAARRRGRTPAPMGSEDGEAEEPRG
ncbi:MAG TPA: BON domain-containing protein [Capillimicrobium sp.]|nr:BON domain-containing protein [Capillimicrobium sp.]